MREPLCPEFGKCGGCSLQNLEYKTQLDNKLNILKQAIRFDDVKVFHGNEFYYRNRMDMIFHPRGLGFREKRKWYNVINIEKCYISNERLNLLIKEIRDFFKGVDSFDLKKQLGTFRYAVIRTPSKDSSISFVLNKDSTRLNQAIELIKEFAEKTTAENIIVTYVPKKTDQSISEDYFVVKGKDMLNETYLGFKFIYSVQGFFQNNHEMAEKMQEYCHSILKNYETRDSYLLDLYGGVGTFGIINSKLFKETTIIENYEQCINAAKINIKNNDIKNAKAILLDATNLKKLELKTPLFVINDPPRSGMHPKTIEHLNSIKPKVIIYVSCNVEQLKKDIPKFKDYEIKSAALFDLFPQTNHSEAIIELKLK